jgi:hypothetical protein
MRWVGTATAAIILGAGACSDSVSSVPDLEADIAVATPELEYHWDNLEPGNGLAIQALLTNQGTRSYYARLGDAFNAMDEQSVLFVATGSDAFLDRAVSSEWVPVERATLIEGVKVVALTPGSTYTLMTYFLGGNTTGTFRLRVQYMTSPDSGEITGEAVSPPFEIH